MSSAPNRALSPEVSGYASSLREALVPIVADHKCSSPEVYGADISPNMLCAGYFDCKSDACQVGARPACRGCGCLPQPAQAPRGEAEAWAWIPLSQSVCQSMSQS